MANNKNRVKRLEAIVEESMMTERDKFIVVCGDDKAFSDKAAELKAAFGNIPRDLVIVQVLSFE